MPEPYQNNTRWAGDHRLEAAAPPGIAVRGINMNKDINGGKKRTLVRMGLADSGKSTIIARLLQGSEPPIGRETTVVTVKIAIGVIPLRLLVYARCTSELRIKIEVVHQMLIRVIHDPSIAGVVAACQPVYGSTNAGMEQWMSLTRELGYDLRVVLIHPLYMRAPPTSFHRSPEGIRRRLAHLGVEPAAIINGRQPPETHVALRQRLLVT